MGGNGKDFAQEPASQFQQFGDIDYVEFVERAELAYFLTQTPISAASGGKDERGSSAIQQTV